MSHHPQKIRKLLPGVFRFSMAGLLTSLALLLVTGPVVKNMERGGMAESILLTVVLLAAVQAVGHRKRVLVISALLAVPAFLGKWLYHFWPDKVLPEIYLASGLVFIFFIIIQLLRYILRAPRVDSEVLCAGVSTYLMLGLLWAFAYSLVACLVPGAFAYNGSITPGPDMTGFTSLYFSLITLTTVGYGDITPVADVARMLAATEALTGTLFVAVLISRLVAVYTKSTTEIQK